MREQLILRQSQLFIPKAIIRRRIYPRVRPVAIALLHAEQIALRRTRAHIAPIVRMRLIRLSLEHADNRLHRIRLVRLHRKVKLH